jgi:hypothetical protein
MIDFLDDLDVELVVAGGAAAWRKRIYPLKRRDRSEQDAL